MDDLNAKLSGILSDPQAMREIAALASQLGIGDSGTPPQSAHAPPQQSPEMSAVSALMPMLGSLRAEDETTRLLDAIRPFLSEERRQKLDKAKKLIRMMRLLPMLRGLDLFE